MEQAKKLPFAGSREPAPPVKEQGAEDAARKRAGRVLGGELPGAQ